jgi:hypothetical protein
MGTALWLLGKKEDAMSVWHQAAAGILDGSIGYGDLAGGGSQGLLLWFAAISLKNSSEQDYALKYLRTRVKRKAYAINWPRPVIQMVLGQISFSDVLKIGVGSESLEVSLKNTKEDLLKRRQVCQALFYGACQAREAANEVECMNLMQVCSELENPIIESEWYLARGEALCLFSNRKQSKTD